MKWIKTHFCKKCYTELTFREVAYSRGVCPYCGNKHWGTFVDTDSGVKRWRRTAPWWRFWGEQGYWEYVFEGERGWCIYMIGPSRYFG